MMYGYGPYDGGGFFGSLIGIIVIVLVIALILRLIRGARFPGYWRDHHGGPHNHDHHTSALETLKQRYAKGDITKEQYEGMKKDMSLE